jgi:hypothetical protein
VIVGEDAYVDTSGSEAIEVPRVHPVVDAFPRPEVVACGDARFEVDDAGIRRNAFQLFERIAPDVRRRDTTRYSPVRFFSQLHVITRVPNVRLLDARRRWVRQDLIDAAPRHHVATQEQRHDIRFSVGRRAGSLLEKGVQLGTPR